MKSWTDINGRFRERLFFEDHEFDRMMYDARMTAGTDEFKEGTGVDVDLVLLKAFGLEADYVTLPPDILGRTVFDQMGGARIEISRDLEEAAASNILARRRLRTTLAHEVGHVACHSTLFVEDTETMSLFPEEETLEDEAILCRESNIGTYEKHRYRGEWWEFQANQCMASLLLPRELFRENLDTAVESVGEASFDDAVRRGSGEGVVLSLSHCFDVSLEMVYYRLKRMGCVNNPQSPLPLIG